MRFIYEAARDRFQKSLGIHESNPDIVDPSRRAFIKAAAGAGIIYFGSNEIYSRYVGPLLKMVVPEKMKNIDILQSTTDYTLPQLKKTFVFGIGDSLVWRNGKSTIYLAADRINNRYGAGSWDWEISAREGADMNDIICQQIKLAPDILKRKNINIVTSGGGNDIMNGTSHHKETKNIIDRLMVNPLSLDAFVLARRVEDVIQNFENNFYQYLYGYKVLRKQGADIRNIIIESTTNVGHIKVNDQDVDCAQIDLPSTSEDMWRLITETTCSRLMMASINAVHRLGPNPGFNILLINNYDTDELDDIHLNDKGLKQSVDQQFERSFLVNNENQRISNLRSI